MAKNELRKRCRCGKTFVSVSPGGVKLTDGEMCVDCSFQERLKKLLDRSS